MVAVFSAVNEKRRYSVILIPTFVALTLYWHTAHILFFVNILTILVFVGLFRSKILSRSYMFKIFIVVCTSVIAWLFVRNSSMLSSYALSSLDYSTLFTALFSKGSYISSQYAFQVPFPLLGKFI